MSYGGSLACLRHCLLFTKTRMIPQTAVGPLACIEKHLPCNSRMVRGINWPERLWRNHRRRTIRLHPANQFETCGTAVEQWYRSIRLPHKRFKKAHSPRGRKNIEASFRHVKLGHTPTYSSSCDGILFQNPIDSTTTWFEEHSLWLPIQRLHPKFSRQRSEQVFQLPGTYSLLAIPRRIKPVNLQSYK